jgi:hypothetical protein
MRTIDISDASRSHGEYAEEATDEPIVILSGGQPTAVLLPLAGADLESLSLSTNPEFLAIIANSRRRHEREAGISSAEMRRRLSVSEEPDA